MFTGLIADLGRVEAIARDGDGATLRISTALAAELGEGDSIAVNGVCLTATGIVGSDSAARADAGVRTRGDEGEGEQGEGEGESDGADGATVEFEAQAMHETLQRSTLGALEPGDPVNLELALRADGRLGGHIVQGHVDGVASVVEVREDGFSRVIALELDPELLPYVVEKGSIALGGVSLTVSALRAEGFEVSLIPETLERTTLAGAAPGEHLNVEVDILAKHVERLLSARGIHS